MNNLLLLLLFLLLTTTTTTTTRIPLLHTHSLHHLHKTHLQRTQHLLRIDTTRRHKLFNTTTTSATPLRSGADDGTGLYFTTVKVGTPSQKFTVIVDTGSDLTWVSCRYRGCGHNCSSRMRDGRRVYQARRSSTFDAVACSSEMCKIELMNMFSLARCSTPVMPCGYDYRYSDGSAAQGIFANDTITLGLTNGRKKRLNGVLIGCTESSQGQSFQVADGVMGLGYSNHSFTMKAAREFNGKFSYCLVDHLSPKNISNYLSFGPSENTTNNLQFTKLVLGTLSPLYAVNLLGISLDGVMLQIPLEVWDVNGVGGTIIDSGTSLTFLTTPAYQPLMTMLKMPLQRFKKLDLDIGPLEYCFDSTGFDELLVPRLRFHFADGAVFEPPVKSYVIDAAKGVKCLGFVSGTWPGTSVIGNIMQQNHLWEFDLVGNKLGFSPSTCM